MNVWDAIQRRYSVRSYLDKPVEDDKLKRVLDAGRIAPSGRNLQNWKFVVVRDAATRASIAEVSDQPFIAEAPVLVAVVSTEPNRVMYCGINAAPVDCAIAIDHMTLMATAEGLGTCWIGHFDQDKCRQILRVPDSAKIIEMLLIGYAADKPNTKRRKPASKVVCWETYS